MQTDKWDQIIDIHAKGGLDRPSGRAGLEAINKIRKILGPIFLPNQQHPLTTHLYMIYEPNYHWLIHYAQKLEELTKIPGNEAVLERLRDVDTYSSAEAEMDLVLKIKLAGHKCSFVPRTVAPTPDLLVRINDHEVEIEITSLNQPYEDKMTVQAMNVLLTIMWQSNCVGGGVWSRVPTVPELKEVKRQAEEKIAEANQRQSIVELNIRGLLNYYIAPREMASQIPPMWRGSSVMRTQSSLPKKDRLARKIEDKAKHQLHGKLGLLVVYDRFAMPDEIKKLSTEKEIELVVAPFKNLVGVSVVFPGTRFVESPPDTHETKEGRVFIQHNLPDGEWEAVIFWSNIMANHSIIFDSIVKCVTDYPSNLKLLFESHGS